MSALSAASRIDVAGISPLRRGRRRGVPALRVEADATPVSVRIDGVQGALPLPRLPRAVRLFQAALDERPHAHSVRCPPRGRTVRFGSRRARTESRMSKFHRLSVASVERETRDAVAITFAVPEALRRALSLRGRPAPDAARRHRRRGRAPVVFDLLRRAGRHPAHRGQAQSGRRVLGVGERDAEGGRRARRAAAARAFQRAARRRQPQALCGFAAGSGITPLLSIVKTTLAAEPHVASSRCSTAIARPAR